MLRTELLKLRGIRGTEDDDIDVFALQGAIDPMCLFEMQTKNILNTLNDDFTAVLSPEFDYSDEDKYLFKPHKLEAPRFLLGGRSITHMGI